MQRGKLISLRYHQALQAWRDGHRCLALADEAGAVSSFEAAMQYEPGLWQAYVDLSRLYQQQGAREAALALLAKAVRRTTAPQAHLAYAHVCCESGHYRRALTHFAKAARVLGDEDPGIYFDWAMAALALDEVEQVAACLVHYRRLRPQDPRGVALADEVPRLLEYPAYSRETPKAQAYIKDRAILLGSYGDDGIEIPQRPAIPMDYRDLATTTQRFLQLARGLGWQWDGFTVGSRSVRPWVQALSVLTGRPVLERKQLRPEMRLLHVELNWSEAATVRLADVGDVANHVWGVSLGIKFGARATAVTGLLAMVSVPWYRTGDLPTALGGMEPGPFLQADASACIPAILRALQDLPDEDPGAQVRYYARDHRHFQARGLGSAMPHPSELPEGLPC